MKPLTIGKLARLTGTTTDTLRYYERIQLLTVERRSKSGYRLYNPNSINIVRFILGAKTLHFTLEEIKTLLALNGSDQSTCAELVRHTESKIAEAQIKISELKENLIMLVKRHGDNSQNSGL